MIGEVNEALLEMHFHRALIDLFRRRYGGRFLKILKPSPQQEAWVGFDQGYMDTTLSNDELFAELSNAIQNNLNNVPKFYFGVFFQFKIVHKMVRDSRLRPSNYSVPYYRVWLSLTPNRSSGISQHETLVRLNSIFGTLVNYACPMVFNIDDIWQAPDLRKLRLVDISTAPSYFSPDEDHFITFQRKDDPRPLWCSDPETGRSYGFSDWIPPKDFGPLNGKKLLDLIGRAYTTIRNEYHEKGSENLFYKTKDFFDIIPESFTIYEFTP